MSQHSKSNARFCVPEIPGHALHRYGESSIATICCSGKYVRLVGGFMKSCFRNSKSTDICAHAASLAQGLHTEADNISLDARQLRDLLEGKIKVGYAQVTCEYDEVLSLAGCLLL